MCHMHNLFKHVHVGATNAEWGQSGVTHLVVSDEVDSTNIPQASSRVQVVKQQWFWESIQIDACADEYLYQARVNNFDNVFLLLSSLIIVELESSICTNIVIIYF